MKNYIEKTVLRKQYLSIRNNIIDKEEKSKIICEKIINTLEYKSSKVIALYKNLPSEVDTNYLIDYSLKNNKIVVLPRVDKDDLKFYKIANNEKLEKSPFGVLEPHDNKETLIDNNLIDLAIIPGICFDTNHNRVGFGKGYYDRFLSKINTKTIAICFSEQVLEEDLIKANDNDIKVDRIITDKS